MDSLSEVLSEVENQRRILLVSWTSVVTIFDREFEKVFLSKNSKARFDMSDIIVDGAKQNWSALLLLDAVLCLLSKKHPQDHRSNRRVFDQHRMLRFCCRSEYLSRLGKNKTAYEDYNRDQEVVKGSADGENNDGKANNMESDNKISAGSESASPLDRVFLRGSAGPPISDSLLTAATASSSSSTLSTSSSFDPSISAASVASSARPNMQAVATSEATLVQETIITTPESILFVPPISIYNDEIDGVRVVEVNPPWSEFDLFREESLSKRKGLAKRDKIIQDFWHFIEQRPLGQLLQEAFEQSLELADLSYSVNTTPFEVSEEEMTTIYKSKRSKHKKSKNKNKNYIVNAQLARFNAYSSIQRVAFPSGQVEQDTKNALSSLLDAAAVSNHLYPQETNNHRSFSQSQAPSLLSLAMAAPISASILGESSTSLRPRRGKRKASLDAFPAYLVDSIMMGAMSDTNGIKVTNSYITTHSKCARVDEEGTTHAPQIDDSSNPDSPILAAGNNMTAPGGIYSSDIAAVDDDAVWNKGLVSEEVRRLPGLHTNDDLSSSEEEEDVDKFLGSNDTHD